MTKPEAAMLAARQLRHIQSVHAMTDVIVPTEFGQARVTPISPSEVAIAFGSYGVNVNNPSSPDFEPDTYAKVNGRNVRVCFRLQQRQPGIWYSGSNDYYVREDGGPVTYRMRYKLYSAARKIAEDYGQDPIPGKLAEARRQAESAARFLARLDQDTRNTIDEFNSAIERLTALGVGYVGEIPAAVKANWDAHSLPRSKEK